MYIMVLYIVCIACVGRVEKADGVPRHSSQLECVALRVVLWESKGKNSNFIGEVRN